MPYVYSTLANDNGYATYSKGGGDLPILERVIYISGGAGVANDRIITPLGVRTEVTDEELEQLEQNAVFKLHKENGYISIDAKKFDVEKVVADMTGRDVSAPIVPDDYNPSSTGAKPVESVQRGRPRKS